MKERKPDSGGETILDPWDEDAAQQVILPPSVVESVQTVLEYLWDEEYKDYMARAEDHRERHICLDLYRIRSWLDAPVAVLRLPPAK